MAAIYALPPWFKSQFLDANGAPYAGGQLFTYESGTTTALETYGDAAGTSVNLNPVILDSAGRCTIFLKPQAYKMVLAPAGDSNPPTSPIFTVDPVGAATITSSQVDISGVAGEDISAGNVVYLSSGGGGLTAGRWYKAKADQSYSSIAAVAVGIAPALTTSGSQISVRVVGQLSGILGGLTPGSIYYIDAATGGAVTVTAPANARIVGYATTASAILLTDERPNDVRRVAAFSNAVGNVGAGEDILATYSDGPDGLYSAGMSWECVFFGQTTNNANAKTLRLRVIEGANNTVVSSIALTANEAGMWSLMATITRVTSTAFNAGALVSVGPANAAATLTTNNTTAAATATFANAIEVRLTGDATTNNDIVMYGGLIKRVGVGP